MQALTAFDTADTSEPRLQLTGMTKRFGAVVANDAIDLTVQAGEIHALLGENGAGKSTLMKTLYGVHAPDEGTIAWNGQTAQIASPSHARELGVSMVYQHFSLFESLTVAENVWLGQDKKLSLAKVTQRMAAISDQYGLALEPLRRVHSLSVGERQRVEIVRALLTQPKLLILDEPTSVLTPQAIEKLFVTLRQLAAQGCSIVYISHKLDEIRALCSACTVLRGGKVVARVDPRTQSAADLSRLMIGAAPPEVSRVAAVLGDVRLNVQGLSLLRETAFGTDLQDIHLQVRAGEVLGIAGVSGNGQAELMRALSGEALGAVIEVNGELTIGGVSVLEFAPPQRRALGMAFVPEERLGRGAVPALSLTDNILLTQHDAQTVRGKVVPLIHKPTLLARAQAIITTYNVKAAGAHAAAGSLSGGNLQKFIVGRELSSKPTMLLIAQPTWGVDVGAAAVIHEAIVQLKAAGCGVLLVSEDLDELLKLSDRVQVIAKGKLSPSLDAAQATREQIGLWMSGLWD
jgi:general nucleoside transport system ATP-binding protein